MAILDEPTSAQHCRRSQIGMKAIAQGRGGVAMTNKISALIGGSVGNGGLNKRNDVRAVQTLLNLPINMSLSGLKAPLKTDGELGKGTQDAIDLYQEKVMKPRKGQADGRVDRGGVDDLQTRAGVASAAGLSVLGTQVATDRQR